MGTNMNGEHLLEVDRLNPLDHNEFRRQGHMIIDFLADYYKTIEDHPVRSQVEPGYLSDALPRSAPHKPEPIEAILEDVTKHIVPGLTHWQSPGFFGFYPTTASTAGILGDVLCSGFSVVPFSWVSSPAATELENLVMEWLGEMLKLPKSFMFSGGGGGVIHGNTCEALICTLTAARNKELRKIGQEKITELAVYCSDQTNCSFRKAAQIVGINPQHIREISTTKAAQFALCPNSLRQAIEADIEAGLVPLYLCATVGTTPTAAADPIEELCKAVEGYGMWIHIDAAYAGAACICPEYRSSLNGIELANSFSFNAHKWFLSGQDCCCVWLRDSSSLRQALSTEAHYLANPSSETMKVIDYKDWQIALSRRFKALRLWLVLRSYGVANLRNHIRSHVGLAQLFEDLVGDDNRFEIVCKRSFSLVCFRISPSTVLGKLHSTVVANGGDNISNGDYKPSANDQEAITSAATIVNEVNANLLERINGKGRVFMTQAVVGGVYVLRFAVGATLVEERHVRMAWKVVQDNADAILSGRV